MSLAVVPDMSGVGIGQGLVNHFLATLKDNGVATVSLTTDRDENARANHFYQRLGFQIARVYETPEGRWLNEYVIDLGSFLPH
jgi:ribosomal protein S18 acetylase RimI-like enzyme